MAVYSCGGTGDTAMFSASETDTRILALTTSTSAAAENVYVDGSGRLFKSTSAMKYKDVVRDHDPDWIWAFAETAFEYTQKGDDSEDPAVFIGLSADSFASHEQGKKLVNYSEDGTPDGLMYSRVSAVFMSAAAKRIDSLERRIEALEQA